MRAFIACLLLFAVGASACRSQERDRLVSPASDLSSLAQEEAKRGVYLFYTQSFIDRDSKRASYRGSIYGAIQRFEVRGCDLRIEAIIVDKFSGAIAKAPTGPLQDTYRYSAVLTLTPAIAIGLSLLEARPAQLGRNTHSVCDEDASCSFHWLRIDAKQRVIHELSTVNDVPDFSGQIDHFVIPVSSAEIGKQLIEQLRSIAASHCQ